MFHFPATPPTSLYIQPAATSHQTGWVTPFGNPGITVQLATPPGISQPHTSFIGHPAPRHPPCALHNLTNTVKSDRNKDTHAHYTNLKQHIDHTRHAHLHRPRKDRRDATACPRHDQAQRRVVSEPQQGARPARHATRTPRKGDTGDLTNRSQGWIHEPSGPCNVQSTHH